jgi:hypothetical protein
MKDTAIGDSDDAIVPPVVAVRQAGPQIDSAISRHEVPIEDGQTTRIQREHDMVSVMDDQLKWQVV